MNLDQMCSILDTLEPGMSITIPKDWFSSNIDAADETDRNMKTIDLVLQRGCTWEQDPETQSLTFAKQPNPDA